MSPFENVEKIGEVTYHLNLPPQLGHVHNVFYISVLKKYMHDPSYVLPYADIPLQAVVTYEEQPTKIFARKVRLFNHKETPMIKVRLKKPLGNWNMRFMKNSPIYFDALYLNTYIQISRMKFLKGEECKNPKFKRLKL